MPRHRSSSPTRRSHGESSGGSGGGRDGGGLVIHRVTKEISSSGNFPALTRTNYYDWAAMMRVMLQARGLWLPVTLGTNDVTEDRMALEVLSKAVLTEMMGTIASKPSARAAWEAIKVMNVSVERVRKAKAGTLRREFDSLKFCNGETVDDFGIRIGRIVTQLTVLGDAINEEQVVRKFLQALPPRFEQIASSIETLLDLSDVSVEELIGRLKATEERHNLGGSNSIASLNLTEDELVARLSSRLQLTGGGGSNSGGGGSGHGGSERRKDSSSSGGKRGRDRGRGDGCSGGGRSSPDGGNFAVNTGSSSPSPTAARPEAPAIHLNENQLFVQLGDKKEGSHARWILDTGATNHMTGERGLFSELDTGVHGTVRFGDGSVVGIEGRGTVLFKCKTGEHQALTGVFHIPRLTANIVSLGQLEGDGYKILMDCGSMKIWDVQRHLLAKVARAANNLYTLNLDSATTCG
ncbi:hypothetical protein BS78_K195100 [Paspalum vaginatum]|uniref:Retrovirus-related Pol polyprotein from transposon TNT 1-94-like beta-barrel domain-containing protein n=1 Tax=Paspalum vaginatum TaxID=158149 RepID=A0A9W7XBV8_9POAL|nr:hypothetical protein BS78_K195100 [Paspalum vaginatum]